MCSRQGGEQGRRNNGEGGGVMHGEESCGAVALKRDGGREGSVIYALGAETRKSELGGRETIYALNPACCRRRVKYVCTEEALLASFKFGKRPAWTERSRREVWGELAPQWLELEAFRLG